MRPRETTAVRATLALLAASALTVGLAATVTPHGFFSGFPFFSSWVDELPPYNEHLATDAGAFYLAFALLFAWAAVRPARALVMPLAAAFAFFSALPLAWHSAHLGGFGTADAIGQTASLAAVLAAALGALALARRAP